MSLLFLLYRPSALFAAWPKSNSTKLRTDLNGTCSKSITWQTTCRLYTRSLFTAQRLPFRFFLMYLIDKPETEFTGQVRWGDPPVLYALMKDYSQESYVWNLFLEGNLDFFPVGDCFRFSQERQVSQTQTQASITSEN